MSELRTVAVGSALVLSLAACTPQHEAPPVPPFSLSTIEAAPSTPAPAGPDFNPDITDTALIAHDAPIHVTYIPVSKSLPDTVSDQASVKKTRSELLSASPVLLQKIGKAFTEATDGRYHPANVSLTIASKMALATCIDIDNPTQTASIETWGQSFDKAGSINIDIIDQSSCDDGKHGLGVAGFASSDTDPILTSDSFADNESYGIASSLALTAVHEVGHMGGLDHAGTADCKEPITISDCKTDETTDPTSVMSYTETPEATGFSIPELGELGLLSDVEILSQPKTGDYTLNDINSKGLKVIELTGSDGSPVYISWEKDSQAAYDKFCEVIKSYDDIPDSKDVLDLEGITIDGKDVKLACYSVHHRNLTHSLQIRTPMQTDDGTAFMALVQRPDRAPDPSGDDPSTGEIKAGTIVYQNDAYTVSLKSVGANSAVVSIVASPSR